jgi:hypothetical protein
LVDVTGKIVRSAEAAASHADTILRVDIPVAGLPAGCYVITLQGNRGGLIQKLVLIE